MILIDTLSGYIQEFLAKSYYFGENSVLVESVKGKLFIFIDANNICRRMYNIDKNTITRIQVELEDYLYYYLLIEKWLFEILFF
jgi:hypothetical protein